MGGRYRPGAGRVVGLPGSSVRSITKSILARRFLLRSADDETDRGRGKTRLQLANLP